KDIAMLLLERSHHSHHGLDKPCPLGTLGPKAAFAPQDARTDRPLGGIVGRLDTFHPYKGPQGLMDLEHFPTDAFCLRHATGLACLEQARYVPPQRTHQDPELRVCQRALAALMPPVEHLAGLRAQRFPNLLGASSALNHRLKVPQPMRPADLPPPSGVPRVGTPAVRHQDATKPFPQQLLCDLGATRQQAQKDCHPRSGRYPQPRARVSFAPPRLVEM